MRAATLIGGITVILVTAWLLLWYLRTEPSSTVAVPAAVAPEIKREKPVDIPIKTRTVKAYSAASKIKLGLPSEVLSDDNLRVIQSSRISADEHPQTVTTVLDTETGKSKTYVKQEPLPWLAIDSHGEVGMYYGVKAGASTVRAEIRQNLIQVKSVRIQAIASIDQPINGPVRADGFIGFGAVYRW